MGDLVHVTFVRLHSGGLLHDASASPAYASHFSLPPRTSKPKSRLCMGRVMARRNHKMGSRVVAIPDNILPYVDNHDVETI